MDKVLRKAYNPNYFSIDAILSSETKLRCTTEKNIPKFGFLAPGYGSMDFLPSGISLELPIWLAKSVWHPRPEKKFISIAVPNLYKDMTWQILEMDPAEVDIKVTHPQFFESGLLCLTTFQGETKMFDTELSELADVLAESLKERILCIGNSILAKPDCYLEGPYHSCTTQLPISNVILKACLLEALERQIYVDMISNLVTFDNWLHPVIEEAMSLKDVKTELSDLDDLAMMKNTVKS